MTQIYQKDKDSKEWSHSICNATNVDVLAYRCCGIVNCRCNECPGHTPSCGQRMADLSVGSCCGEAQCCVEDCLRRRSEMHQLVSRIKGCDCISRVSRRTCENRCGTCYLFTINLEFDSDEGKGIVPYEVKCGMNDYDCVNKTNVEFYEGATRDCWYKRFDTGTRYKIRLTELKVEHWNIAIVCVFGFLAIMCVVVFCIVIRKGISRCFSNMFTSRLDICPEPGEQP